NTKDYYLTETTEPGYKDLELASDFYNLQSRYYSFMEKEGSDYFSAEFMFKVSSMSKLFSRLNDLQRKIPQGLEINLEFTKAEKELLNFQLPSISIINTIDVDGKCLQLHATLKPSAGLKVQLFNKILPRVLLPFYKKTEFKELLSEK
ncbi:MAG: hypothetical protein NE327_09500, partial [Lentisphaeraceae bacterium]|nr:hypothetical protein [Lentisphaeraceae bacterium]